MSDKSPQVAEPAPPAPLKDALAAVAPDSEWTPTDAMLTFAEGRIRRPHIKRPITLIRKLKMDPILVESWFQDAQFLEWYAERMERADQLNADVLMRDVFRRALKGDGKAARYWLNNRDRRIIRRRQAAASAQAAAAAHVTVEIIAPRDPVVRECEATILKTGIASTPSPQ